MPVDFGFLIVAVIAIHTVVLGALSFSAKRAKEDRTRLLWKLFILEMMTFPIALGFSYYFQPPISWLTTTADAVYSIVVAFVLGLEIPGFVLLSRFDEGIVSALEEVRKDIVILGYSFEHITQLKATIEKGKGSLSSAHVDGLLIDFIVSCDRMNNLDRNFWGLVLLEVTKASRYFAERSKHPSPRLIDVMSLAGLSFLLAQFLRLFG